MEQLTSSQRRYLSRLAHDLDPVVMIGKNGFTASVVAAVDQALDCHELIKVRFVDYKADRVTISEQLADQSFAAIVRVIGNVAVLYRPHRESEKRRFKLPVASSATTV